MCWSKGKMILTIGYLSTESQHLHVLSFDNYVDMQPSVPFYGRLKRCLNLESVFNKTGSRDCTPLARYKFFTCRLQKT
jgi:hypothetical protein